MADNNETTEYKLDLDNASFLDKAKESLKAMDDIAGAALEFDVIFKAGENIAKVFEKVSEVFKEVFDTFLDAEAIEQTSIQFQSLANNAGLFSEELLDGLKKSSAGWVDENTLMKAASRTLVEFQTGAEKIPEVMDLARKASMVMGGDIVSNFQQISQAVASGNARQLRHLGLIVDQQKAYRDYAQSIGVTVDSLNQAGRQQAILNAALEEGKRKFKDNQEDVRGITNEWNQFKAKLTEVKETFILVFDHTFGPLIQKTLHGINYLTSAFAHFSKTAVEFVGFEKKHIEESTDLKEKAATADIERVKKHAAEQLKVRLQLDEEILRGEKQVAETTQEATRIYMADLKARGEAVDAQIKEVQAKRAQGVLTEAEAAAQITRLNQIKDQKMRKDDDDLRKAQEAALSNYMKHSQSTFDGIGRGFSTMTQRAKLDITNFGKVGDMVATTFGKHTVSMFKTLGEEGGNATDKMKEAFFSMIGDVASQYGEMMILASLFPPDPPVLAAGIALEALGGFLGGMSKGGGGASAGAGGGGSGGSIGSTALSAGSMPGASASTASPGKSVNIMIQGHMLMNDQSQRWLVEQIRAAADATDFKVQSVGGGL